MTRKMEDSSPPKTKTSADILLFGPKADEADVGFQIPEGFIAVRTTETALKANITPALNKRKQRFFKR